MSKTITYQQLDHLLRTLGFRVSRPAETHLLYEQPEVDAIILLPPRPAVAVVSPFHLLSARTMVLETGLTDPETFERLLDAARDKLPNAAIDSRSAALAT